MIWIFCDKLFERIMGSLGLNMPCMRDMSNMLCLTTMEDDKSKDLDIL